MTTQPILLVEDDAPLREALAATLELGGYDVCEATDGTVALDILRRQSVAAVVTDYQMQPMDGYELLCQLRERHPGLPVLLMTAHGTIQHAVQSMQEGATDYLVKPFSAQVLTDKLAAIIPELPQDSALIAADPGTLEVLDLARRVATGDATVLLTGESGTGKEVFARFIHTTSARRDEAFVAINCAAIPENMLEAVLFGHEKGAFTGAVDARAGKFEQAQGGTLLLDEISEMDLGLQAKLLRVIQEREVERIGARRSIPLDVRLLATTNCSLAERVQDGRFREDLYYRLSVFPIELPPLRARPRDIVPLARHFLQTAGTQQHPPVPLTDEAARVLESHDWPGNVRELQNLMQRAVILSNGTPIRPRDLRLEDLRAPGAGAPTDAEDASGLQNNLKSVEGQMILDALDQGGSRQRAAEILGISPRTLRYKIARLRDAGIQIPAHRGQPAAA